MTVHPAGAYERRGAPGATVFGNRSIFARIIAYYTGYDAMKGRTAGLIILGICTVLALLLVIRSISPLIGGSIFAVSLVLFGGLSSGFRRR
jgi:hypothetical protein